MTVTAIVCQDSRRGIGKNGAIPWRILEDLKFFKNQTVNNAVVMGRKTWDSLCYPLPNRLNFILTSQKEKYKGVNNNVIFGTMEDLKPVFNIYKKVFIIGGEQIYKLFMDLDLIDIFLITQLPDNYNCDTFMPRISHKYKLDNYTIIENYKRLLYTRNGTPLCTFPDSKYLKLCKEIITTQEEVRLDRTGTGTFSSFGEELRFDISKYIPLYTTKFVPWKACIEELLWFLRGDTDVKKLKSKGVKIWDGNSSREFLDNRGLKDYPEYIIGEGYGYQWRNFGGTDYNPQDPDSYTRGGTGFDQIEEIIRLLKEDPYSRRILLSAWNPLRSHKMSLVPCHYSIQFYVKKDNPFNKLSAKVILRSNDLFLGNPFNVFSYAVMVYIIALKVDMIPDELIISIGDAHIYTNHVKEMKLQMERPVLSSPILHIKKEVKEKNWEDISIEDFDVAGYNYWPSIKGKMAI